MAHERGQGREHSHGHGNRRAVGIAAALTGSFMVAEVLGGIWSGSLALLADAGHMLTDFGSLLLAWAAFALAERPADRKRTYGFGRFSVLAAFVNGVSLFAITAWIVVEAFQRLLEPAPVDSSLMLVVAALGLVVNIACFWVLTRGDSHNLNIRAAVLHVLGDLLGSVAAIVGAVVIMATAWTPIDPILSLVVAALIARSAYAVVKESGHILLEGTPAGFDGRVVKERLPLEVDGIERADHVHAWCITQERLMATLEVCLLDDASRAKTRAAVKRWLHDEFGIDHVTVELLGGVEDERRPTPVRRSS